MARPLAAVIRSCSIEQTRTSSGHALFRAFHSTPCRSSGSILNLSGLSVSRESRFLSKERGLPRTEFSPHLELIRSSEVEPFMKKGASGASEKLSHSHFESMLPSVGYLLKELENLKTSNGKAEAALRVANAKCESREREAAVLAVVTLVLTVGLIYSAGLYQGLKLQDPSPETQIPQESSLFNHEPFVDSKPEIPKQHTGSSTVFDSGSSTSWSQLIWASQH
ncbi:hypothetical protein ACLMJK_006147 [Lecanora helva]